MDDGMLQAMRAAKRPVTLLSGTYGHPLHPIAVTVPIGAWVASLVFDLGAYVTDSGAALVVGSRWLIVVGLLGAAAAAMIGFLDLFAIPAGTPAFRTALVHMALNLTVTVAYLANVLLRPSSGDTVPAAYVALSAASLALLAVSGYLGGTLTFRYGVRVAEETTQAEGYRTTTPAERSPS